MRLRVCVREPLAIKSHAYHNTAQMCSSCVIRKLEYVTMSHMASIMPACLLMQFQGESYFCQVKNFQYSMYDFFVLRGYNLFVDSTWLPTARIGDIDRHITLVMRALSNVLLQWLIVFILGRQLVFGSFDSPTF